METPDGTPPRGGWGITSYFAAFRNAGPLFGAGIQLAASVVLMFFLGRWLDGEFNTSPWLMIAGILFGVGAGLYNFIRAAIRAGRDDTGGTTKQQ